MDEHSFSAPDRVRVRHLDLDLVLDFEERRVRGSVALDLERTDPQAPLLLDSNGLTIESVRAADGPRPFRVGPGRPGLGEPLLVELEPGDARVTVHYHTDPAAEALQWLEPAQTAGGTQPFLYTQGQSILTRSWIPLQDSPRVRVTYTARVRAPEPLVVTMSAQDLGVEDGAFRFRMDQPIPAYLIALACGRLERRELSERCAVLAEPEVVDAAAFEFADAESMVQACERLFGPYRWGRYDVLILPPSFPFGGMENPRVTFLTPTVLAGDRSLVSILAHELAHSWSGNLVTNATWRDFWLNEGFTVYCEKRIMEVLYGPQRADLEKLLDFDELRRELAELEPWKTVLHVELDGRHPDEAFSTVPYEKGALFLRRLEAAAGRERFDAFLHRWFEEHAFQSVTTPDFEQFLSRHLLRGDLEGAVDVHAWLHAPGLPADAPRPDPAAFARVDAEVRRFLAGTEATALETQGWGTQEWLHFLNALPPAVEPARLAELDRAFDLRHAGNHEIRFTWLRLGVARGYGGVEEPLEEFLLRVGRRKYLKPLYQELAKTPAGLARARAIYARARPGYHSVSRGTIDGILGWPF